MKPNWIAVRRFVRSSRLPKPSRDFEWIVFPDGRVAFLIPTAFTRRDERDETIAVYPPGDDSGITLRFTLHAELLDAKDPPDVAEQFVCHHATEKQMQLTHLKGRVYLSETREVDWPDRRVLMHHWQVGIGRIFVVASATVWGADRKSKTVSDALNVMPQIIESFRLT